MKIRSTFLAVLGLAFLGWGALMPATSAQAECKVLSATPTYNAGDLKDHTCNTSGYLNVTLAGGALSTLGTSTAAAPSLVEGAPATFSFDLAGNARFTMGTLLSGEDQANNVMMIGYGATRVTTFSLVHANSTSSTVTILPSGPIRFMAAMGGASESKAFTLGIYGNYLNSTTGGILICTVTIPAATATHIEDICPLITPDFSYYFFTTSAYTSASAADIVVTAMY